MKNTETDTRLFSRVAAPKVVFLQALPLIVRGGATLDIQFQASETSSLGVTRAELELSVDGGTSFQSLAHLTPEDTHYLWQIPTIDNENAVLRYSAYDRLEYFSQILSPTFRIKSTLVLTQTKLASPLLNRLSSLEYGGDCESGLDILIDKMTGANASPLGSVKCDSSNKWKFTVTSSTDGVFTYRISETDVVDNHREIQVQWTRDTTAPVITQTKVAASTITNTNSQMFGGACETGLPVQVQIGAATGSPVNCVNQVWAYTASSVTDGAIVFTFRQTDGAGNVGNVSATWTRDTVAPALTQNRVPADSQSNSPSLNLGGACENGLAVTIETTNPAGQKNTANVTCSGAVWSYLANATADGSYQFAISQVDAATNATRINVKWLRDTVAPVLGANSLQLNGKAASTSVNFVSVDLDAADILSNITEFCLQYSTDSTSVPTPVADCWTKVNDPDQPNLPVQKTLALRGFKYRIGFTPHSYLIYAWAKDAVGNVSNPLSASIDYFPGVPPTLINVIASAMDTVSLPLSQASMTIANGQPVYIRWKVADAKNGLEAAPISIYYTTDDVNFQRIAENVSNSANGGCTLDLSGISSGCYRWTSTVDSSSYFRIRVTVTDKNGMITASSSNFLNGLALSNLAGNTDDGIGSSASATIFQNERSAYLKPDPGSLVVTNDGQIFFRDYKKGLLWIRPTDGVVRLLLPTRSNGDNTYQGPISVGSTAVRFPAKIALDYKNGLVIWDYDRIRRIDLKTFNISTIAGGGNLGDDGIAPTSIKFGAIGGHGEPSKTLTLVPLPNGDLVFQSDYYTGRTNRLRYYSAKTGLVTSISVSGVGHGPNRDGFEPGALQEDLPTATTTAAGVVYPVLTMGFGVEYDPTTSVLTTLHAQLTHVVVGNSYKPVANLTPTGPKAGEALAPHPPFPGSIDQGYFRVTGRNGRLYTVEKNQAMIARFDKASNQWIRLVGTGVAGNCPDGTPALACAIQPSDAFVDAQGILYFVDRGRIRTVDGNQNVISVYGQSFFFGDGGLALSARFNQIPSIQRADDGRIVALDPVESRLREFSPGGIINTIAGNGSLTFPDTTTKASEQTYSTAMAGRNQNVFSMNPVSGDIYSHLGNNSVARLDRSTNLWVYIKKGIPDAAYCGPNVLGFRNGELLAHTGIFSTATNNVANARLRFIAQDGTIRELAGIPGETSSSLCPDGTANASCQLPSNCANTIAQASYDPVQSRWLLLRTGEKTVRQLADSSTAVIGTAATFDSNAVSFAFVRDIPANTSTFYYCGTEGRIHALGPAGDSLLPWRVGSITCTGHSLLYDPVKKGLLFPYLQNGLAGVGFYQL